MQINLNQQEAATVCAALLYWKREGLNSDGHEIAIANRGGEIGTMQPEAIEALSARISETEEAAEHFSPEDRAYILEQAKTEWCSDELEIYDDSMVTESPDEGAWIEAKVFISFERCADPECRKIEGSPGWGTVGDGYDGYCPSCADKREEEGVYNG